MHFQGRSVTYILFHFFVMQNYYMYFLPILVTSKYHKDVTFIINVINSCNYLKVDIKFLCHSMQMRGKERRGAVIMFIDSVALGTRP